MLAPLSSILYRTHLIGPEVFLKTSYSPFFHPVIFLFLPVTDTPASSNRFQQSDNDILTLHTSFLSPTALQNLHYTASLPIPSTKDIPPGHALIATALGVTVIVTSSSDEKLETAKKLGATHGINYRTNPNWEEEVIRLTNGKGVDHAVEIGGAQSIEKSVRATKQGGLISVVGILSEDRAVNLVGPILFGAKIVRGVLGVSSGMVVKLLEVIQEQRIRPVIAREFEWKDAKQAFEYSIGWSGVGKIVIKVGDGKSEVDSTADLKMSS
ncbi:MAG: hypothetical protein Q9176_007491 [Flavoplaca citrina]